MNLTWRVFVLVSLWTILNNLPLEVQATLDFIPTVILVGTSGPEGFSNPVHKKPPPVKKCGNTRNISIVGDDFVLDGKTFYFVGGSMHYFRLPAAYWRDRLRKLKAAGLNVVTTYTEWSYHEPEERQYTFEGDADVVKFIQTAAEEGLYVSLRVGPYICAERDMGGLPYWLLSKYPDIRLRTPDKNYQMESKIWLDKLFSKVSQLLYGNGGPIILVQVENEYGSYGSDMTYKLQVRDMILQHVGDKALLFTTDGSTRSLFTGGAIPNTLTTIDFSARLPDADFEFSALRQFMPHGPLMNSEFYTGWLTHWGQPFQTIGKDLVAESLEAILRMKAHVNFYMFFGGSNFGFTSGANYDGTYQPDITSYDYDAPLNEAGDPTPKYFAIRDTLKKFNLVNESLEPIEPSPKGNYGPVKVAFKVMLLSTVGRETLGKKYADVNGPDLPTFEQLRQKSGLMLYETTLPFPYGLLEIKQPRDMIIVFLDSEYQGCISRSRMIYDVPLEPKRAEAVLSLLVENQGRINFGRHLPDFKGILSPVTYKGVRLNGTWTVTGYPLEPLNLLPGHDSVKDGPAIFEGRFTIPANQTPLDTFLDTTGWAKGYVWVNGHNLGRYWPRVGPQVTMYVPGVWLKAAPEENLLQILELLRPADSFTMNLIDYPILNRTASINNS